MARVGCVWFNLLFFFFLGSTTDLLRTNLTLKMRTSTTRMKIATGMIRPLTTVTGTTVGTTITAAGKIITLILIDRITGTPFAFLLLFLVVLQFARGSSAP